MTTSQTIWSPRRGYNFKVRLIGPTVEDKTVIYDVSAIEDSQSGGNREKLRVHREKNLGKRKSRKTNDSIVLLQKYRG